MNSFHMVILMSLRKKIVLCVAITAAMGIALMYCAAHYSAGVLDVESAANIADSILSYNDLPMFPVNSRGQLCQSSDPVKWMLGNKFYCVGDNVHACKISDVINATDFYTHFAGSSSFYRKIMFAEFNSGKTVVCNTIRLPNIGYNCNSFNDSVIPEQGLVLLKYSGDGSQKLIKIPLKDDIIKYSKYKMSSYVGERCEEMPYTGTFVRSTCKLPLSLISQAKLEIEHGKAGKCTEVVNKEDFSSSVLSCKSRGKSLLDHVFSESGHYICSLKQGHLEL